MTFEEYMDAAGLLRKYAKAVETHLYINMRTDEAHRAIELATKLADLLETTASSLDTTLPPSSN
jgi:hypothetical protein